MSGRPVPSVPQIGRRSAVDLAERIAALAREAELRGFGTVAYCLETARAEALAEAARMDGARLEAGADPAMLWRV